MDIVQVEQKQGGELKLKAKCTSLKWILTIFFLLWNLTLLAGGDNISFYICMGILANGLAVATFVLLSIFPRTYYVFDQDKISIRSHQGKEKRCIYWKDVILFGYSQIAGFPIDVEIRYWSDVAWGEELKKKGDELFISFDEYNQVVEFCKLKERSNIKFY